LYSNDDYDHADEGKERMTVYLSTLSETMVTKERMTVYLSTLSETMVTDCATLLSIQSIESNIISNYSLTTGAGRVKNIV